MLKMLVVLVNCTLILTKGFPAKAFAVSCLACSLYSHKQSFNTMFNYYCLQMSGLSVVGQDKYGVFPLKGKLLNVRRASIKRSLKDTNIQKIMDILGLQYGKIYEDAKELRYGHLIIMADQVCTNNCCYALTI